MLQRKRESEEEASGLKKGRAVTICQRKIYGVKSIVKKRRGGERGSERGGLPSKRGLENKKKNSGVGREESRKKNINSFADIRRGSGAEQKIQESKKTEAGNQGGRLGVGKYSERGVWKDGEEETPEMLDIKLFQDGDLGWEE